MTPTLNRLLAAATLALAASSAAALEITVLSAGAVEPGIKPAIAAFERASGHVVKLSFAAAPALRTALKAAPAGDVIVAPQAVLDEAGVTAAVRAPIGKVGVGIAIRQGADAPDITSADSLKAALASADSVVFNRASTGTYVETMLPKLGVAAAVDAKSTRVADGASVMRRLLEGKSPREFGFAAMTEIVLFRDQGIRLVGPLPAPLQNDTSYLAAPWPGASTDAARGEAVAALMRHLQSTETRAAFANAGIELAR